MDDTSLSGGEVGLTLPHLTSAPISCRAPPHTPKGVVVRQLQRPTCPTSAVPKVRQVGQLGSIEIGQRKSPSSFPLTIDIPPKAKAGQARSRPAVYVTVSGCHYSHCFHTTICDGHAV
jgi:hypothetical protein